MFSPKQKNKLWPLGLYHVSGHSMEPTYREGDLLVGWKWGKPKIGKIVVASHSGKLVVKRLAETPEGLSLTGDSPGHDLSGNFKVVARVIQRLG